MKSAFSLFMLMCGTLEPAPLFMASADQQPPRNVGVVAVVDGANLKIRTTYLLAGNPDSVLTRVTGGLVEAHRRSVAGTAATVDSFTTPRPAAGVTVAFGTCVQSKRSNGQLSAEVCAGPVTYTEPVAPLPPPVVNPPVVDTTVPVAGSTFIDTSFEDGAYGGMAAEAGNGATVAIVTAENGVTPYTGSKMVKFSHPMGAASGSAYAQVRYRLNNNPPRTTSGVYARWRVWVPVQTFINANSTVYGTDAQIKHHLFRVATQNPADYSPPGYNGLVLGLGYTFGSKFSIAKDHLNIWIVGADSAVDNLQRWDKYPRYTGGAWLTVEEWYQTADGINTQYKLWLNGRLTRSETFTNTDGTNNKLIGGATTTPWDFRVGMPYLVNRSNGPYVLYVDDVSIRTGFIP